MADHIVFTGARLLDGEHPAQDDVSVVVADGRITHVETGPPPETPQGAPVRSIALGGKTLMPGMFQCHFHTGFGPVPSSGMMPPVLGLDASPPYMGILATRNARIALDCGVTGIIGSSNPAGLDVALKEAILIGVVEGPRMLACTREFVTPGDAADGLNRSWYMELGAHGLIRRLNGAEEFRFATREELGRGADVVKLSIAPGHGTEAVRDINYLTAEELDAVVSVARDRGKMVRAHCPSRIGVIECARAGVNIIDHADRIDQEGIDAVLAADATVVPSMLWSERLLSFAETWDYNMGPFPINDGFPETRHETEMRLRGVREDYEYTCSMLPRLHQEGVRMVLGDDYGFPMMPHGDYVSEMELYVKIGIPALDVLRWATRNGAELMGRGEDLGCIAPGRTADLVVVEGDPSSDISCLREGVRLVMKEGEVLRDRLGN